MDRRRRWMRGANGMVVRSKLEERPPAAGDAAGSPRGSGKRARLGLGLRLGLRDTYDYLGSVLLLSVTWSVAASAGALGGQAIGALLFGRLPGTLPLLLGSLSALAGLAIATGPLLGGLFRFARNAAARQEPEIFDLAWGFRRALGPSLALAALQLFLTVVLAGNCYFYLLQKRMASVVLGSAFGYLLGFWLLACLYQWPLLVEQEIGALAAVRKSALLVLDNLGYSLLLALVVLVFAIVVWIAVLPGVVLWGGAAAVVLTQSVRELLRKYGSLPPDPTLDPIADETHELGGYGWHE